MVAAHLKTLVATLWLFGIAGCVSNPSAPNSASGRLEQQGDQEPHRLSVTRQLRRITLTLTGEEPTPAEYEALLGADEASRQSMLTQAIDDALSSPKFYEQMLSFGHDYLPVGSYQPGTVSGSAWIGNQSIQLTPCPQGTFHQGKLGIFLPNKIVEGDPPSICDDPTARTDQVKDPWFAPGTLAATVGRAGTGVVMSSGGIDCGIAVYDLPGTKGGPRLYTPAQDCSCGPHLIYCHPTIYDAPGLPPTDGRDDVPDSQRRAAWQEPARLFAHIITNDKPFSDLVVGDYTVVNLNLQHMYVRLGRINPANKALDDSLWFLDVDDPAAWREVPFEAMHPNLLSRRSYSLDPRVDASEPAGVPAAGVLTSLASIAA